MPGLYIQNYIEILTQRYFLSWKLWLVISHNYLLLAQKFSIFFLVSLWQGLANEFDMDIKCDSESKLASLPWFISKNGEEETSGVWSNINMPRQETTCSQTNQILWVLMMIHLECSNVLLIVTNPLPPPKFLICIFRWNVEVECEEFCIVMELPFDWKLQPSCFCWWWLIILIQD